MEYSFGRLDLTSSQVPPRKINQNSSTWFPCPVITSIKSKKKKKTRPGVDRVKPTGWLDCSTMSLTTWETCISHSYTKFVYPGCWPFDNGASAAWKIDDVLLEYDGLPHVLPLAQVEGAILKDIFAL